MPRKNKRNKLSFKPTGFDLRSVLLIFIFALTGATLLGTGFAAKGGGGKPGGNSSLNLVLIDSTDGVPHWGQQVSFDVSTTETTQPQVSLDCYQSSTKVYGNWTGYWDGYPWPWTQTMTLKSQAWTSGAADCTAKLYYSSGRKTISAATLNFHVYE